MLAELENISYYVQAPGHNKRFPGHNSGGIIFHSLLCPGNISYYVQTPGHNKRFSGHNSGGIKFFHLLDKNRENERTTKQKNTL